MRFSSLLATTWSLLNLRERLLVLTSRRCFWLTCSCMILPEPVTRKRFLAPLWVFVFGIEVTAFSSHGPPCGDPLGRAGRADCSRSGLVRRDGVLGRYCFGALDLGRGALRLDLGRVRNLCVVIGSLTAPLSISLGLGLGLLPRRSDDHDHVAAILLGRGLYDAKFDDVLGKPFEQPTSEFGTGLLTTTEHDRDLNLVATSEESLDVALLRLIVMRVDLGPKLHLFDDSVGLIPACLACLQCGLVLELAVVHKAAYGRTGVRGNLDKVEIGLGCQSECVLDADDSNLFAIRSDKSDLWYADPVVDPGLDADVFS
jgi:hypothetical protein